MISFIHNKVPFLLEYEIDLSAWLTDLALLEEREIKKLQYNYVSSNQIQEINKKHLNHDYSTDVIAFDYSVGKQISAEVFICNEQVEINAREYSQPINNEMLRVICHALFHLCGYNDKTDKEKSFMRLKENKAIAAFHTTFK